MNGERKGGNQAWVIDIDTVRSAFWTNETKEGNFVLVCNGSGGRCPRRCKDEAPRRSYEMNAESTWIRGASPSLKPL